MYVPEGSIHVLGYTSPVMHAAWVRGLNPVLPGTKPPVATGPEEVGVVVGVVTPAKCGLDAGYGQP